MAKSNAVWGIDIGQCALKALRCVPSDEPDKITADAFDFIEYPKILSQPEADPVELVRDALQQFLSRNKVKEDRIAISVPGQAGLARFIKLPPVESKKIPDIVRYEARQQIPFALEDVVFDWQQMAGGSEEDGFSLETEVGFFAMKREQVFRALRPFIDANVEVDIIQLTPLTLYNFVVFDQLKDMPELDTYEPSDPPPSTIVVSLGTDTTDLVITNGFRVWQRNIPLGGNHFTKALTKELKLTFAKAEHLKRNALKAEDPKAVFLAMRPVFNDLVTEVQRSISFFQSVDRSAKIGRVIPLGNAMKLRGLQKYLGQSLGYEVVELTEYQGLSGAGVVGTPAFKENLLSFGVCYGLALQGLKKATLRTNLIPPEIIKDRLIRAKKPWAVATVAALLLGCTASFFGVWRSFDSARNNPPNNPIQDAISRADKTAADAARYKTDFEAAKTNFDTVRGIGERLNSINERRVLWPEVLSAVAQCVPHDPPTFKLAADNPKGEPLDQLAKELTAQVHLSQRTYIDSLDCEFYSKLEDWYADTKEKRAEGQKDDAADAAAGGAAGSAAGTAGAPAAEAAGPTGEGWVIQIKGHHFHNLSGVIGAQYVRQTLLNNLQNQVISLPTLDGKTMLKAPIKDLGIAFPVLVQNMRVREEEIALPGFGDQSGGVNRGNPAAENQPKINPLRYDFAIQFCWKETPLSKRLQKEKAAEGEKTPALASGANGATVPHPN